MQVCHVHLHPDGITDAEWKGRMWFRRVPVHGESVALFDSSDGRSDWPSQFEGRIYRVETVTWFCGSEDDRNPAPPLLRCQRIGRTGS